MISFSEGPLALGSSGNACGTRVHPRSSIQIGDVAGASSVARLREARLFLTGSEHRSADDQDRSDHRKEGNRVVSEYDAQHEGHEGNDVGNE